MDPAPLPREGAVRPRARRAPVARFGALLLTFIAVLSVVAPASPQAEPLQAAIAARIEVLRQQLAAAAPDMDPAFSSYAGQLGEQLDAAAAANRAGLPLAALTMVRESGPPIAGVAFHTRHAAGVTTREAHAALSDATAARLAERVAALEQRGWQGAPMLARAMGEAAGAYVTMMLDGGRAFGADAGDFIDGLLYIGMAEGSVEFAEWLASLPLDGGGASPSLTGLEAQMAGLDGRVLDAYRDPAAQVDSHPAFIRASSALKVANGLLGHDLRPGALLAYLEAERAFGELAPAGGTPPSLDQLEAEGEQLAPRMAAGIDHSIAARYRQLAEWQLMRARSQEGEEATASRSAAALLLQHVIPRYLDVVNGTATAAPAAAAPEVAVTLVRWPFT